MKRVEALEKLKNVRTIRESGLKLSDIVSALEDVSYSEAMNDESERVAELKSQIEERDAQIQNLKETNRRQRQELKRYRSNAE